MKPVLVVYIGLKNFSVHDFSEINDYIDKVINSMEIFGEDYNTIFIPCHENTQSKIELLSPYKENKTIELSDLIPEGKITSEFHSDQILKLFKDLKLI